MYRLLALAILISSCSGEFVKVIEGKDQTVGMKAYNKCEEAPEYLIFPKPYPVFTMKGVRFPVKIIGLRKGEIIYSKVHYPGEETISLPNPDMVIEVPVCKVDLTNPSSGTRFCLTEGKPWGQDMSA